MFGGEGWGKITLWELSGCELCWPRLGYTRVKQVGLGIEVELIDVLSMSSESRHCFGGEKKGDGNEALRWKNGHSLYRILNLNNVNM